MKRWLVWLIPAAVLTVVLAARYINQEAARKRREIGYANALKSYSQALHPGMTRKDVEDYLRSKNATSLGFSQPLAAGGVVKLLMSSRSGRRPPRGFVAKPMFMWLLSMRLHASRTFIVKIHRTFLKGLNYFSHIPGACDASTGERHHGLSVMTGYMSD